VTLVEHVYMTYIELTIRSSQPFFQRFAINEVIFEQSKTAGHSWLEIISAVIQVFIFLFCRQFPFSASFCFLLFFFLLLLFFHHGHCYGTHVVHCFCFNDFGVSGLLGKVRNSDTGQTSYSSQGIACIARCRYLGIVLYFLMNRCA